MNLIDRLGKNLCLSTDSKGVTEQLSLPMIQRSTDTVLSSSFQAKTMRLSIQYHRRFAFNAVVYLLSLVQLQQQQRRRNGHRRLSETGGRFINVVTCVVVDERRDVGLLGLI